MQLPKPKREEVIIKIVDDPARFTEVISILYADGFFDEIWKIKEAFDPDPYKEYPIKQVRKEEDHFLRVFYKLRRSKDWDQFNYCVRDLRYSYGLSTHYERLIHKLIFTGVINDDDYVKAYYEAIPIFFDNEGDDLEELHCIVIHQGTRIDDLKQPLHEYLVNNGVVTKTAETLEPSNKIIPPKNLHAYCMERDFNKYVGNNFPCISEYYWCYQQQALYDHKPLQLALKLEGISKKKYKKLLASNKGDDKEKVADIRRKAKSIPKGIERLQKIISPD